MSLFTLISLRKSRFLALTVALGSGFTMFSVLGVIVGTLFVYVLLPPLKCSEHTLCPLVELKFFLWIKWINVDLSFLCCSHLEKHKVGGVCASYYY